MRYVTWLDMQYQRELEYYGKLRPVLEGLKAKHREFSEKTHQQEREFLKHLGLSVKIDRLPQVASLLAEMNSRLRTDLKVNVFLFQSPLSTAACIPRYGLGGDGEGKEMIVLVSQHFLNELNAAEQISILGHELGHLLFGHVHVPGKVILESDFPMEDVKALKNDVLKWMTCAEVSCDMVGYVSCGCDVKAFSSAMLKYTTGLSGQSLGGQSGHEHLIGLMLQQFEEIASSALMSAVTTHPLTALRLRIVHSVSGRDLLRRFQQSMPDEELAQLKVDFNRTIDSEVGQAYPELIPALPVPEKGVLADMCLAVALSDGKISPKESEVIGEILGDPASVADSYRRAKTMAGMLPLQEMLSQMIDRSVHQMKARNAKKSEILSQVRQMLVVAASDGHIERNELETIHNYAMHFGLSKQEIVIVMNQLGFH